MGAVADRGADEVTDAPTGAAAATWREAMDAARRARRQVEDRGQAPKETEIWIDEGPVQELRPPAGARPPRGRRAGGEPPRGSKSGAQGGRQTPRAHEPPGREPAARSGRGRSRSGDDLDERARKKMRQAADLFAEERFAEARRALREVAERFPAVAEARELLGLANYRLERWRDAARELEAFRTLTGSTEQHPVLADCYRALRRHSQVEELWDELATASPAAALVAEGRIVTAGSRADRGDLAGAVAVLEPAAERRGKVQEHHLRLWYALADVYERAGDHPRAREWFQRVATHDARFADVRDRLESLG